MSKTTTAIIVKFLVTLVAAWVTLMLIGSATWSQVLIIGVVATALNYLLGDLVILRASSNTLASIVDGLVAAILAYAVMEGWGATVTRDFWAILIFGVVIAGFEFYFHNYLKRSEEVEP